MDKIKCISFSCDMRDVSPYNILQIGNSIIHSTKEIQTFDNYLKFDVHVKFIKKKK